MTPQLVRSTVRFTDERGGHSDQKGMEGLRPHNPFQSPPTLTASASDNYAGGHLFTPMVDRKTVITHKSTVKPPSFYAKDLFSSPAPFWRYMDIGSTPARIPDPSPIKANGNDDDDDDDEMVEGGSSPTKGKEPANGRNLQASSPPHLPGPPGNSSPNGIESPTRPASRPASRHSRLMETSRLSRDSPGSNAAGQANGDDAANAPEQNESFATRDTQPTIPMDVYEEEPMANSTSPPSDPIERVVKVGESHANLENGSAGSSRDGAYRLPSIAGLSKPPGPLNGRPTSYMHVPSDDDDDDEDVDLSK